MTCFWTAVTGGLSTAAGLAALAFCALFLVGWYLERREAIYAASLRRAQPAENHPNTEDTLLDTNATLRANLARLSQALQYVRDHTEGSAALSDIHDTASDALESVGPAGRP